MQTSTKATRILLGSDHAGITLKNLIKQWLISLKYQILDVGTDQKASCHYPLFAQKMALNIKSEDRGILVCGSGIGIGIAANKCGLKCSSVFNQLTARECGKKFQVMSLGQRVCAFQSVKLMIQEFLGQKYQGETRKQKINKVQEVQLNQ